VRDERQPTAEAPAVAEGATPAAAPAAPAAAAEHHDQPVRRVFVERPAEDIRKDVEERLRDNPYVDATGISVVVDGSDVTLEGLVDGLFAVSVARSLAANVAGVRRVETQLKVRPAPRELPAAETAS
jgi:hypothetical protein